MSKLFLRSLYLMLLTLCLPSMASAENVAKIGATGYGTLAAAVSAAQAGDKVEITVAGDYTLPNIPTNITIEGGVDGVVFNHTTAGNIASIPNGATFKNVTFNFGNVDYHGFQHAGTINMKGCTLNGKLFSYGNMNFTNCQFVQDNSDYHMWCYDGDVTYENCTFTNNKTGKFLNVYNEGNGAHKVTVTGCQFINNSGNANKAAINVKATYEKNGNINILDYTVNVENSTAQGAFPAAGVRDNSDNTDVISSLVQVDDRKVAASAEHITVEVENVPVYQAGAETEVVKISTVAEFKAFRDAVNSGTSYKGKIVRLMADLDLSSEANWTPIGNLADYPGVSFKGTFDGNGHIISNLTVNDNTPNYAVAALFGSISEGSIVNLTVKDVNITSTHFAAGIVAYTSNTPSIINCHVVGGTITSTPELVGSSYDNGDKAGGIMGYCTTGTTIKDCTVEGVTITAYRDLAGICGYADGTVTDCTVKDVTVVQDNTNGYKTEDVAYTACKVVGGRSANAAATNAANTTENVTVKTVVPVAKIGTTYYATLEEAIAAAQDGDEVTLLANCAGNGIKVAQGKFTTGLTVNFGGFTYTVDGETVGSTGTETNGFQLLKNNKITFKNGTITSTKAKILVQNYSDLTLDGMTLTLNNPNYASAYTLSNNNGNVVIDGTTINANPAGGFAFDVCRYSSYPSVNVEVKGSSVINGNVEISASGSDAKDGFGLTLTSGTMSGNIVVDASAATAMEATPGKATVTKNDDFTQAAPAGFEWKDNGNGTSTLTELPDVAQIGDVKYKSLAAAVAAVPTDGTETTITVIADQTINVEGYAITIPANKNVVLELNGHEIIGSCVAEGTSALIRNLGTLTIQDNTDTQNNGTGEGKIVAGASPTWTWDGTDDYTGSYASNLVRNEANLVVNSGYLLNVSTGSAAYAIDNYTAGDVTINGGKIDAAKASAIRLFNNNGGSITVTDGVIGHHNSDDDCSYMGIQVQGGANASVSVSGGNIAGQYALYANNTAGSIEITDGTFDGYVAFGSAGPSDISISGGNYTAWVGTWGNQTGFISGGNFATDPTEYCAAGYIGKANGDNTYSVVTGAYVAQIGTTKYETLEEAIAAAQDGDEVTLLADCAGNGIKVAQGKFATGLIVDFGGFTYTVDGETVGSTGTETQAFQLLKDNTITFKNGAIVGDDADVKMLIQNYSNLTLDNMTLDATQGNNSVGYVLSTNNGSTTIKDTKITAKSTGTAFDACSGWGSYTSNAVEVTGNSVITGNVEVSYYGQTGTNPAALTLTSGTLTGNIVMAKGADQCSVTKDNTFSQDAPEGYEWKDNSDGTSTLVEKSEYIFTDGTDTYTITTEKNNVSATYKRDFTDRTNKFQGWLVPFDYTITDTDIEKFEFREISKVEFADENKTKMQMRLGQPLAAGTTLEANKPYVFVPTTDVAVYEFTATSTILKAADVDAVRATFNVDDNTVVSFYGVYTSAHSDGNSYIYYMGKSGNIGYSKKTTLTVGSFRWIFKITDGVGNSPSFAYTFGVAEDNNDDVTAVSSAAVEAEGEVVAYYTLAGQKVSEPTKGVYVVKYANGTSKKVVF